MEEAKLFEKNSILAKIWVGKYKILISFIVIFLINLFFFASYNLHAMLFVDTSRELYIPMAMNDGAILYKDIFNVYAPLGYQINAFLTSIFGENIGTFFYAGFINSTFILWGLFLLIRFIIKGTSLYKISIICFIVASCVYSISQTNYVFPYSYSMIYALNAFIWSLVCILYFYKKEQNKYLYLSFLFYGISLACKYEFLPFIIVLLGICINKKITTKQYIISLIMMLSVPFLSLLDLVTKGVTVEDLKQALTYITLLSKAKSVNTLYSYLGFIPNIHSLKLIIINFIKCAGFIFSLTIYYLLLCYLISILNDKINKYIEVFYTTFIVILGLLPVILTMKFIVPILITSNAFYLSWIGVFLLILFISKWKQILSENKYLFIIFISTILCSIKCILNISFNSYGTYFFPLIFICCILYFSEIAINTDKEGKIGIRMLFFLFMCILIALFSLSNIDRQKLIFTDIKFPFYKGELYPEKMYANSVLQSIRYIKQNTQEEDKILVLPEGAMINFFTDRKSHNKFYYLIPPNIEVFGEENIVKELEKDLPEYLVIQPMSFTNFNETYFCESFGTKICNLIPKYYEKPLVFGNDFWIAIYKLKNKGHDIINTD